jgi:hypothetical protein
MLRNVLRYTGVAGRHLPDRGQCGQTPWYRRRQQWLEELMIYPCILHRGVELCKVQGTVDQNQVVRSWRATLKDKTNLWELQRMGQQWLELKVKYLAW